MITKLTALGVAAVAGLALGAPAATPAPQSPPTPASGDTVCPRADERRVCDRDPGERRGPRDDRPAQAGERQGRQGRQDAPGQGQRRAERPADCPRSTECPRVAAGD